MDFFAQQVVVGKDVQGKPSSSKTSTTVDDRGVMDDHVIENDHVIVDDHGEESAADFANQEEVG